MALNWMNDILATRAYSRKLEMEADSVGLGVCLPQTATEPTLTRLDYGHGRIRPTCGIRSMGTDELCGGRRSGCGSDCQHGEQIRPFADASHECSEASGAEQGDGQGVGSVEGVFTKANGETECTARDCSRGTSDASDAHRIGEPLAIVRLIDRDQSYE